MADRKIDDLRIKQTRPLIQPAILTDEIPRLPHHTNVVAEGRSEIEAAVRGEDRRTVVIVGPCSVHDVDACTEYAGRLKVLRDRFKNELIVVMRAYFEKPRTVGGWKGLINDPDLDGTHKINIGLRLARTFLRDLAEIGVPAATEFVDTTVPQHIADLVSWGAIGARTVESQTHRELASGLSMPIGFKNATDGRIQPAIDAVHAASRGQWFASTTKDGVAALSQTTGNDSCHIVLRGGMSGPNYAPDQVENACHLLETGGLRGSVVVDCSHGNSGKDHLRQPIVCEDLCRQIQTGNGHVFGVMLESHLVAGRQDVVPGQKLTYGQSITDACIDLDTTERLLEGLAKASLHAVTLL